MSDAGELGFSGSINQLAKRSIDAFKLLDANFTSKEAITAVGVHSAFASDPSQKRFRAVKSWLSKKLGLDFAGSDVELLRHRCRIQKLIETVEQTWIHDTVKALLDELYHWRNKRLMAHAGRGSTPMALVSIELAVKYALSFLSYCQSQGASDVAGITQGMADGYAEHRPKVYQSLGSFFRFLNRTSHRLNALALPPKIGRRNSTLNTLDAQTRGALVREWLSTRSPEHVRNAAIALLVHLYAQRLPIVLDLKRDQVKDENGTMTIDFGSYGFEISSDVADVIRTWMNEWREISRFRIDDANPFLFPGYLPGQRLSEKAFSRWLLKRHGVLTKQLFATAVHGLIESGLDDPGVLVSGLGLTASTALKYWTDSGRDITSFLFAESIHQLREQGLLGR